MLNIGPQELLIVLIIALIVVGPQRLPDLSRQIGKGLREFRKVQDEVKGIAKLDLDEPKTTPRRAASSPTAPAVHRTPRPAPAPAPAVAPDVPGATEPDGSPPAPTGDGAGG
jgi:sec-independent protein translocase protein TatB